MRDEGHKQAAESTRKWTKTGACAAGLAVGTGAAASTPGAIAAAAEYETVVIPSHHYRPDVDFDVLAQFGTLARDTFFEHYDDVDAFDDPSDWEVYAIRIDDDGPGIQLGYLLVEPNDEEPEPEDSGTIPETASFWNHDLNLLELDDIDI